jgi:hypothetical protein
MASLERRKEDGVNGVEGMQRTLKEPGEKPPCSTQLRKTFSTLTTSLPSSSQIQRV